VTLPAACKEETGM